MDGSPPGTQKLRVAVTGSTGVVGRGLCRLLSDQGHTVYAVRRRPAGAAATWKVETGRIELPEPVDVLIHLAGRNALTRWTRRIKREIWDSRVTATEKLCAYLASQPANQRPKRIISASAIGIYGNRGDEILSEDSPLADPGNSFLAEVCRAWEAATQAIQSALSENGEPIRITHLRIGVALSAAGGALAGLHRIARWGLAGQWGGGRQFISWISMTDLTRLIVHLAQMENPPPVLNAVGPETIRQRDFIALLAEILHRPAVFSYPASLIKMIFGQMGSEALLSSHRVISTVMPSGFAFQHTTAESAIRAELNA